MAFDPSRPFQQLPEMPPARESVETVTSLRAAIGAARALAELDTACGLIPNASLLIRLIGLREAKLSAAIENIVTTRDELYRAIADRSDAGIDSATKEVLRYNDALWHGFSALITKQRPLTTFSLGEEIARILTQDSELSVRRESGTYLGTPERRVYTPPDGEARLRHLLQNLDAFLLAADTLDPLIKTAILHYQFEAIHPFRDGNGRTGRILCVLYLIHAGLLRQPVLYLSGGLLARRSEYYERLRQVTERAAWTEWIVFFLETLTETARETRRRIDEIQAAMQATGEIIRERLPKIYSRELVEALFARPYLKISFLVEQKIAERQTAARYLQALVEIGLLSREPRGRDVYFRNETLLALLGDE